MSISQSRIPGVSELKEQAKRLRSVLTARQQPVSHGAALELMAAQYGYRDWNTLQAIADQPAPLPPCPYQIGSRVSGRYLGQAFQATILSVQTRAAHNLFRVTLDLDEPVDVVQFDSFSALRKRITLNLRQDGTTNEKTSDGRPHMTLEAVP